MSFLACLDNTSICFSILPQNYKKTLTYTSFWLIYLRISKKSSNFAPANSRWGVCMDVTGWGSRHIEWRLLTLVFDFLKRRKFQRSLRKQVEVDEFFEKGNGKYDTKTKFWVEYIDYTKDREIQNLIIRDQKNNIRFSQLTEDKEKELGKLDVAIKKAFNEDEELEQRIYNKYKIKDYAELLIKQKKEIVELINNG